MTNPKGLTISYASRQGLRLASTLPYQKTNPKGLFIDDATRQLAILDGQFLALKVLL